MQKKGMSEAKRRANKKWNDANLKLKYDRLSIFVPKGRKAAIEARANAKGLTVNSYTGSLYQADLGLSDDEWKAAPEEEK